MDERTPGLKGSSPEELEREVARIREGMMPFVRELDERRHEMMNWRHQVKRTAPKVARIVGVMLAVLAGAKAIRHRIASRRA
jgi:predicted oxidoreductase